MEKPLTKERLVRQLSRRQFVALAGGAAASLVCGLSSAADTPKAMDNNKVLVRLTLNPCHNPGYACKSIPGGERLLWCEQDKEYFKAYRLNANATRFWRMCNGARTREELVEHYASKTGRPREEAELCLQRLLELGLLASGGTVVVDANRGTYSEKDEYAFILEAEE